MIDAPGLQFGYAVMSLGAQVNFVGYTDLKTEKGENQISNLKIYVLPLNYRAKLSMCLGDIRSSFSRLLEQFSE